MIQTKPKLRPRPRPDDTISRSLAAKALVSALDQSEQVKSAVEECAAELASVNMALKEELTAGPSEAGVGNALYKTEKIETKVQDCAAELTTVNAALEVEVEQRHVLNHRVIAIKKEAVMARHAAFHDPLTSLANRAKFDDRLAHGLAQAKRHGRTMALMFIDLDGFKRINDTYGHAAGDLALQVVASRLKGMARDEDTVARLGGDEFLYLLTELRSEQDASGVALKILEALREPCDLGSDNIVAMESLPASIGIAIYPKHGETPEAILGNADKAMYRAKREKLGHSFAL